MSNDNDSIKNYKNTQKNVAAYIFSSLLVSVGASFLVSGISLIKYEKLWIILIVIGCSLIFVFLIFILILILKSSKFYYNIEGFVITEKNLKNLIYIPEYNLSLKASTNLSFACLESKDIRTIAENGNLAYGENDEDISENDKKSISLYKELLEYYLLEALNLTTEDHFNIFRKLKYQVIGKDQLPKSIQNNRFLSLFTTPTSERDAFDHEVLDEKVITCFSEHGYYSLFELFLPKKTKISKDDKGIISIKNKFFKLSTYIAFNGYTSSIDEDFIKYILHKDEDKLETMVVEFRFEVKYSKLILTKRNYYLLEWIDKFINCVKEDCSKQLYFDKINWNTVKFTKMAKVKADR